MTSIRCVFQPTQSSLYQVPLSSLSLSTILDQETLSAANELLGMVGIATHSSNLGGWVGEKSKALKLEGKERFEPQAATQQLRAPV